MSQQGNSTQTPDLITLLRQVKGDIFNTLNCVKVGTIHKVDLTKRTAEVLVAFKRILADESNENYPMLLDVPIVTLQGGGGALTFPISKGDECLVLFSDANLDAWYATGGEAIPMDGRQHNPSDAIAIVGLNSLAHPLAAALVAQELALTMGGAKVGLKGGKVKVANGTQSLLTALTDLTTSVKDLIIVLNTLTTIGSATTQTISPATVAALVPVTTELIAVQTKLDALLY